MPNTILKYRINELLNALPFREYKKAVRIIPRQLGISEKTFSNYRNIGLNDLQDIPHEKVVILEKLFSVQPGELDNFIVIATPISSIEDHEVVHPIKITIK